MIKSNYKKIHFIGIGGIGMSALARLFKSQGVEISGSDSSDSEIIHDLKKEGIAVFVGHSVENVSTDADCVIYTLAISADNPEFIAAQEMSKLRNLPMFTYAQMLGQVSSDMYTIAVSGTHGKTTTTAMIYSAMSSAKLEPNLIVGSLIDAGGQKTNFVSGNSNFFVVEACEYKKSFLNLSPTILAITNIEADHLDYYKDLADVKNAFMEITDKVPESGVIICDFEDKNLQEIIEKHGIYKIGVQSGKCINYRDYISQVPELFVIGDHNIKNAAIALAVCDFVKNNFKKLSENVMEKAKIGLAQFRGTWRRMEFRGQNENGATIYDDYGHHPTEIRATLSALQNKYSEKRLVVFFQPHLYSRTKTLFDDFVKVFNEFFGEKQIKLFSGEKLDRANQLFLLPIYAAREPKDPEISSEILAQKISGATALNNFDEARTEISKCGVSDIVLTIGAGDVYHVLN